MTENEEVQDFYVELQRQLIAHGRPYAHGPIYTRKYRPRSREGIKRMFHSTIHNWTIPATETFLMDQIVKRFASLIVAPMSRGSLPYEQLTTIYNRCTRCRKFLPVTDFPKMGGTQKGLHPWCRQCRSNYNNQVLKELRSRLPKKPTGRPHKLKPLLPKRPIGRPRKLKPLHEGNSK
jgi:hypothetical protein